MSEDMMLDAIDAYTRALHIEADAKAKAVDGGEEAKAALEKAKALVKAEREYRGHAIRSRGAPRIKGMLELSKPNFLIKSEQLDADPFILNTPYGVVNLKTGKLKIHDDDSATLFCTKITAATPGSQGMEMWYEFLKTITCEDSALMDFLQLVAGMAAIGRVYHEGIIMAIGSGRNGKSTFFNALAGVLGDYAGGIDVKTLTTDRQSKGASLSTLRGKRLVIASELEEHQRLSTSTLKQIASTDKLVIEEKFRNPETVDQSHTLVLCSNHMPRVGSTDNGTWRRLTVVPFNATIPAGSGVQNYADKLIDEAGPAILSWVIMGSMAFVENDFKLNIPMAVEVATEEYRHRENWLENFIEERCILEPGARTGARELYLEYKEWATEAGEYVRRENDFSATMEAAGYQKKKSGSMFWYGLRLNLAERFGTRYSTGS